MIAMMIVFLLPTFLLAESATSVLFIGNSFIYAAGSPIRFYRADTVTDLNRQGLGGVPALFKSFTSQASLDYDVYLETEPGSGLEFHLEKKLGTIARRGWDKVVMNGQSTLDFDKPGDPTKLINTTKQMAEILENLNTDVEIYLMSTWSRADQVYPPDGAWSGKPIEAMANDIRGAYDKAAAAAPRVQAVIPVGEAWTRAMKTGVADANPYDGIDFGKLNLWTGDQYHASAFGYYLEALVIFGSLTGLDPRSLGDIECSGFELGMGMKDVSALQQIAFDELNKMEAIKPRPFITPKNSTRERCLPPR
jgi:hypothetical protein